MTMRNTSKISPSDCPVCLVPHDPEIHSATVAVHAWFRAEVMRKLEVVHPGEARSTSNPRSPMGASLK